MRGLGGGEEASHWLSSRRKVEGNPRQGVRCRILALPGTPSGTNPRQGVRCPILALPGNPPRANLRRGQRHSGAPSLLRPFRCVITSTPPTPRLITVGSRSL